MFVIKERFMLTLYIKWILGWWICGDHTACIQIRMEDKSKMWALQRSSCVYWVSGVPDLFQITSHMLSKNPRILSFFFWKSKIYICCYYHLHQRFSNFFQVGTTFISQNILRTTLILGLSNSLGLP